jgi:hypothetical protein
MIFGDKIKENEVGWVCSTYGGQEKCVQVFGIASEGRKEGRKHNGRRLRRWEYNIKMNLKDPGLESVNCINLTQERGK